MATPSECDQGQSPTKNQNQNKIKPDLKIKFYHFEKNEKPEHVKFLKLFRVNKCDKFRVYKCPFSRPYTCFDYHFPNQRRRRPMQYRDGTFNYSPYDYCKEYDEEKGTCPNGDACSLLHRNQGDSERLYHLVSYKTMLCPHETNKRGNCRNEVNCSMAHSPEDRRKFPPDQTQRRNSSEYFANISEDEDEKPEETSYEFRQQQQQQFQRSPAKGQGEVEEFNPLLNESCWQSLRYVFINYKTHECKSKNFIGPTRHASGFSCPYFHNPKDRRRNPIIYKYHSNPCKSVKKTDWGNPLACPRGDECLYCHTRVEQQFHPDIFKSLKCKDHCSGKGCPRGPLCAFAHSEEERKLDWKKFVRACNASSEAEVRLELFSIDEMLEKKKLQMMENRMSIGGAGGGVKKGVSQTVYDLKGRGDSNILSWAEEVELEEEIQREEAIIKSKKIFRRCPSPSPIYRVNVIDRNKDASLEDISDGEFTPEEYDDVREVDAEDENEKGDSREKSLNLNDSISSTNEPQKELMNESPFKFKLFDGQGQILKFPKSPTKFENVINSEGNVSGPGGDYNNGKMTAAVHNQYSYKKSNRYSPTASRSDSRLKRVNGGGGGSIGGDGGERRGYETGMKMKKDEKWIPRMNSSEGENSKWIKSQSNNYYKYNSEDRTQGEGEYTGNYGNGDGSETQAIIDLDPSQAQQQGHANVIDPCCPPQMMSNQHQPSLEYGYCPITLVTPNQGALVGEDGNPLFSGEQILMQGWFINY